MGSKYESKLTAAQWATFADKIVANVRARYTLSAGDEEEVRYQVLGRVQRDPTNWAPSNYNPYQQCLEDIKRINEWKKDAAQGHTWTDHMAAARNGALPPQFPLRAAVLASIGVLRNGQTRAYREASTKFDDLIRQAGIEFLARGRAPNGFWAGLDMEVDFNKRPADRVAKKHDLPRRPRYFMTRQQGIAHRSHVASTQKWLDPTRASTPNPYLSPRASQAASVAQMLSGSVAASPSVSGPANASSSGSVPASATVTGASGSKIPVPKRTARQRQDSSSPEKPPSKASRPELTSSAQKVSSASASLLPRPQKKKLVNPAGGKQSEIPSEDNTHDKATEKPASNESVIEKTGGPAEGKTETKKPADEPEKSPSAQESNTGEQKAQDGVQEKSRKVRFDPNVQTRVIFRETPLLLSKKRGIDYPPGSQFYIPPFRKSSDKSSGGDEKAGASNSSSPSPAQSSAPEKSPESSEAPKAGSGEISDSVPATSEDDKPKDVPSGLDVQNEAGQGLKKTDIHNEAGEGLEQATEKQMEEDQVQGDGSDQMPALNWLDVLKPGNKLANGVVIWDVRLLLGEWEQDDFLDFLFIVDDVYWSKAEWVLQESYFVQLAKAYPVGPKNLAKLVKYWDISRAEDMEVDLNNDHPISLAEKTYTRTMGEIYNEAEKEEFRVALVSRG